MHRRRREADLGAVVLFEMGGEFAVSRLDALEAFEKIDVEEGAAELAVGDPLEAHILLGAHDLANARVLDSVQFGGGQMAGGEALARLAQPLGAKKAADVVGAKRRRHGSSQKSRAKVALRRWSHVGRGLGNRPSSPATKGARALHRRAAKKAFRSSAASLSRKPP